MRTGGFRVAMLSAGALALSGGPLPPGAAAEDRIVIEAGDLRPAVVETTVDDRVTFVNRSGRVAHVEFFGTSSEHRVFQIPGEIWAEFHVPGRHAYAVHLSGASGRVVELRGVVVVGKNPAAQSGPPECDGAVTVMGVCLER
jgi:plastocyanin